MLVALSLDFQPWLLTLPHSEPREDNTCRWFSVPISEAKPKKTLQSEWWHDFFPAARLRT